MHEPKTVENNFRNRILASLPADEYARMAPHLERVHLDHRQVLIDPDQPIQQVYFPESSVISVLSLLADGTAIETATVGWEGIVGLPIFLGVDRTPAQAFCQVRGEALRMDAGAFREAARPGSGLAVILNRYTQALFTFLAQASACNGRHTVQERCARWLLLAHDRVGRSQFPLEQQFLSQMLGVRRAAVLEVVGSLQSAGLIEYTDDQMTIKDRSGLEAASCECYVIIQRELERLLADREIPSPLEGTRFSENGMSTAGPGRPRGEGTGEG
jgi:CRP-like cAMP-binding protein